MAIRTWENKHDERFDIDDNKQQSEQESTDEKSDVATYTNPIFNNELDSSQNLRWSKSLKYRNPNLIQKVSKSFLMTGDTIKNTLDFFKSPPKMGGAKKGQKYTPRSPTQNKFTYTRNSSGKRIRRALNYRNPDYERFLEEEIRKGNKDVRRTRSGGYQYNTKNNRLRKILGNYFSPKYMMANWEVQRQKEYQRKMQQELMASKISNPFTEVAIRTNTNLEGFENQLKSSQSNWQLAQEQFNRKLNVGKRIVTQQRENMKEANILNAPRFSGEVSVDIFENILLNPSINIMTKREDSIDILMGAKNQGKPNIIQCPDVILCAPDIFKKNLQNQNL